MALCWLGLFAPLITIVSMGFFNLTHVMKNLKTTQSACYLQLTQLQQELALDLRHLLQLNPQAQALMGREAAALSRLAAASAAGAAGAMAEAQADLAQVKLEQTQLKARQDAILHDARLRRQRTHLKFVSKMQKEMRLEKSQSHTPLGLAVIPHPPLALAPVYQPSPNFQEDQAHSLHWRENAHRHKPSWWTPHSTSTRPQSRHCSVSLRKESSTWKPTLHAVNASSNFSSL